MADIKDGGPAFPLPTHKVRFGGMSLRDYFAGQVLSNSALMSQLWEVDNETTAARAAYILADAMLKAREAKS